MANVQMENRQTFFERVGRIWPVGSSEYALVERAYNTAKEAFRGVVRDGGERYFEHLRHTAIILIEVVGERDPETLAASLLHDVVEDIDGWTFDRVYDEFGFGVAVTVLWVTKPKVNDPEYPARFAEAPAKAVRVKLADCLHNTRTLGACVPSKRARKLAETRKYYQPLATREPALEMELAKAIAAAEAGQKGKD